MAEYSVVLAVITVASVAVFPAFGAAALNVVTQVTGLLP
jgi:Flp pilus assembly pilin Flp